MSEDKIYATDDVSHAADFDTPLHQGILRYVPNDDVPVEVKNALPAKNDRPFIYVPMGYLTRAKDDYMKKILSALNLTLPNLILVTAESQGSAEEQLQNSYRVQNPAGHAIAKDWTDDHTRYGNFLSLAIILHEYFCLLVIHISIVVTRHPFNP